MSEKNEKMMTFEEWWEDNRNSDKFNSTDFEEVHEMVWDAARLGMVPAENTVVVPPVSEWPEWATGIVAYFCIGHEPALEQDHFKHIKYIPRPVPVVPAWTPKVGEAVFVSQNGFLCTGKVHAIHENGINVTVDGKTRDYPEHLVKPFFESKIGLPWEQI